MQKRLKITHFQAFFRVYTEGSLKSVLLRSKYFQQKRVYFLFQTLKSKAHEIPLCSSYLFVNYRFFGL